MAVPSDILSLADKQYLFKIEVNNNASSNFEPSYRVKKICWDPVIISKFKSSMLQADGPMPNMNVSTPTSVLKGSSSSSSCVKVVFIDAFLLCVSCLT